MTSSSNSEFASLMLFNERGIPFGYMTFRNDGTSIRCWKGCEEALNISGASKAQFKGDKYFGDLYKLTTEYRENNYEDPAIVVGLDDEQVKMYRGKGYGIKLISLALEISKLIGKRFIFQDPNSRFQKIIDVLTRTNPGPDNLSTQIDTAYQGLKSAVYPKFL